MSAFATAATCQWMMGPSVINEAEVDGGKVRVRCGRMAFHPIVWLVPYSPNTSLCVLQILGGCGVKVERCRYVKGFTLHF